MKIYLRIVGTNVVSAYTELNKAIAAVEQDLKGQRILRVKTPRSVRWIKEQAEELWVRVPQRIKIMESE